MDPASQTSNIEGVGDADLVAEIAIAESSR